MARRVWSPASVHRSRVMRAGLPGLLLGAFVTTVAARGQDDAAAAAVFAHTCVRCHTEERIVALRRTRAQWEEVLDQMVAKGATGTDDDFETVLTYLLRHHGRANVNKAPATDLVLILQVSTHDASVIVEYRTDKGPFADFDALAAVPGIDVAHLTDVRDAIAF